MRRKIRLLLVDDEWAARARLCNMLDDIADQFPGFLVTEAVDGFTALRLARKSMFDVAVIDVGMPGMTGIELAGHLSKLPASPFIIFVTADEQHAVKAFDLDALDYLLKPVRADRLAIALKRVPAMQNEAGYPETEIKNDDSREFICCVDRNRIYRIPVDEIIYLKAEQKYVVARTAAREFLLNESLVQIEAEFDLRFIRVHRNCLVARKAITGFRQQGCAAVDNNLAGWHVVVADLNLCFLISRRQWKILAPAVLTGQLGPVESPKASAGDARSLSGARIRSSG